MSLERVRELMGDCFSDDAVGCALAMILRKSLMRDGEKRAVAGDGWGGVCVGTVGGSQLTEMFTPIPPSTLWTREFFLLRLARRFGLEAASSVRGESEATLRGEAPVLLETDAFCTGAASSVTAGIG